MFVALIAAAFLAYARADAQSFGLGVVPSAPSVLVSNSLTYTISVTNLTGFLLSDVQVSNVLPASVQFVSAVPGQGDYINQGNIVVFDLLAVAAAQIVQMTLTMQPTVAGLISNTVTVVTSGIIYTPATTNVVTQVTNAVPPQSDLGVAITVPSTPVIVNDLMTYGLSATNLGPDDAAGVMLTNTLPPGVIFIGVVPTNQTYSIAASNLVFNLGTLTAGGGTNLQFTIQPTNAGLLTFSASIGSPLVIDTNTANNTASNSLTVINYLSGQLVALTNSAQIVNQHNGLIEQSVLVSNTGTNAVPAVRVVVAGLTNVLFNASGTNSGNPFVVYAAPLAVNQSATLLLQYAPRKEFSFANSQLQAFAVPVPDLSPPPVTSVDTNFIITRLALLSNGSVIIEFPTTLGRSYTVVYSDNVLFSNAMIAPPAIVAPANQVQWIDYGPPTTVSLPADAAGRFYRIIENP